MGRLKSSSSSLLQAPPLASIPSRFTVARTEAACWPPITEMRAFGHIQRKRGPKARPHIDRKSTRLNSSHSQISYAVFCLKKKKRTQTGKSRRAPSQVKALDSFGRKQYARAGSRTQQGFSLCVPSRRYLSNDASSG